MRHEDRVTARRQLDKRLSLLSGVDSLTRPPYGWIKAVREALGMTTAQLGKRLGVSQPWAAKIEQAEKDGAITHDSLERAARALDCRLVYALVPRKPLDNLVAERAKTTAKKWLETTGHSMKLEAQGIEANDENEQLKGLIDKIAARFHHKLVWIHLFPNGNGRHARLATDLFLTALGQLRFAWGRENLVDANETRQSYMDALCAADQHEYGPLLAFVRS